MEKKQDKEFVNILDVLSILWHYAWALVLVAVLCGIGGYVYADLTQQPTYTASSYIYVNNTTATTNPSSTTSEIAASKMLADTYTVIARMNSVLDEAQQAAGTHYSYGTLAGMVSVNAVEDTGVLRISVTAGNAQDAMNLANGMINAIPSTASKIIVGSDARVMQEAELPSASMPNKVRYAVLFALAGVLVLGLILVLSEVSNDRILDAEYLQNTYNIPLLAVVPDIFESDSKKRPERPKKGKNGKATSNSADYYLEERAFICDKMSFSASEGYRILRTSITTMMGNVAGGKAIGITSPHNNEGKSLCAMNTSYTFGLLEHTLLLEGDLRIPTIAKRFSIKRAPGFSELIRGKQEIADVIQRTADTKNLDIITSGNRPSNPAETLASDSAQNTLSTLTSMYDYIIMDLPPVNELADAVIAGRMLDGVIIVINEGETSKSGLRAAIRRLEQANTTILGFVMVNAATSLYEDAGYGKYGKYGKYSRYSKYSRYGRYSRYSKYNRYGKYGKYGKYDRYSKYESGEKMPAPDAAAQEPDLAETVDTSDK